MKPVSICLVALLATACVGSSSTTPGGPGVGPTSKDTPPPQDSVVVVTAGRDAVEASLRSRRLRLHEVFGNADVVVVEYAGDPRAAAVAERNELAFVLAAAAVAFPHAKTVEAHRFVQTTPRRQASALTLQALRVIAGDAAYDGWVAGLRLAPLTVTDSVIHQYAKAHRLPPPKPAPRTSRSRR